MQPSSIMRANAMLWAGMMLYWALAALRASRASRLGKVERTESMASRVRHVALLAVAFLGIFGEAFAFEPLSNRFLPDSPVVWAIGNVLTASGLCFAIWARVHLGKYWSGRISLRAGHRLISTGPYRLVRHPIYSGIILAAAGSAVALGQYRGLVAIPVVVGAYLWKLRSEEKLLRDGLGREYEEYRTQVKAVIPFLI